ncbi:MAG: uroporphyrinogen decarboxylase family protein, partial [Spirochaetota bacterium]
KAYVEEYRNTIMKHKKGIGDTTVIIMESDVGLENARSMAGIELFSYLVEDEPQLASEWLEALNEKEIRRAKAIADLKLVPIMLTHGDIAYKTGLIHPPEWLRKEFIPRLKKLVAIYHNCGVKCLFHSDGNLNEILDDLVMAGIDGLNPVETTANMHIADIRKKFPSLFLAGGIDASRLLTLGTPEEVRETCKKAIDDTGGLGYLIGSTTELLPMVKVENLLSMIEVAHNYKIAAT